MPPERFSRQAAREVDEKSSLPRQNGIREGQKWPEFATNWTFRAKAIKYLYINDLAWLWSQSSAKGSLGSNSLIHGKIQGNLADLAAKAGRRLGFPIIDQLLTSKFPTHPNREFSGANRELFSA